MLKFAVIGHPVAHSLSPCLHTANFKALGLDATYEKIDVAPGGVSTALKRFAQLGYRGINVTVPHKVETFQVVTYRDPSAEAVGAVNTVLFQADGTTCGYNTDSAGFVWALNRRNFKWYGSRVLVCGAGGAAQAVVYACIKAMGDGGNNAQVTQAICSGTVWVANRTVAKAQALVDKLLPLAQQCGVELRACSLEEAIQGAPYNVLVNATTIGLKPTDNPVWNAQILQHLTRGIPADEAIVYDIIPCARETATLQLARECGLRSLGGLEMLAAQAAAAFEIWTGLKPDMSAMCASLGVTI